MDSEKKFYRLLPTTSEAPKVGERTLVFVHKDMWFAYMFGWHDETCNLYEVTGDVVAGAGRFEDVQMVYSEADNSDMRTLVETAQIVVKSVEIVNTIEVREASDGSTYYIRR